MPPSRCDDDPILFCMRRDDPDIEYCPHCYNARGPEAVQQRARTLTDPEVLAMYGGGAFPLLYR